MNSKKNNIIHSAIVFFYLRSSLSLELNLYTGTTFILKTKLSNKDNECPPIFRSGGWVRRTMKRGCPFLLHSNNVNEFSYRIQSAQRKIWERRNLKRNFVGPKLPLSQRLMKRNWFVVEVATKMGGGDCHASPPSSTLHFRLQGSNN